jgi:hypothetical protein
VHTPVEFEVTDVVPSPVVLTVAVKPPPNVPLAGRFEMEGALGAALVMVTLLADDGAPAK